VRARIGGADRVALNFAEPFREPLERRHIEPLVRKPQHAMPSERDQHAAEGRIIEVLAQVQAADGGTENGAGGFNNQHQGVLPCG